MQNENEPKHEAKYDEKTKRLVVTIDGVNAKRATMSKKHKTLSVALAYVHVDNVQPVNVDGKVWRLQVRAYIEYVPESEGSSAPRRTFEFD